MLLIWTLVVVASVAVWIYRKQRNAMIKGVEAQFPGPKTLPLLGNALDFASNSEGITKTLDKYSSDYKRFFRMYLGPEVYIFCYKDIDFETILSSNTHITKGDLYRFHYPWIGYGLLTSTGQHWKQHRRIITPTFHFKILDQFLEVFNRNGAILCDKLGKAAGKTAVDIYSYVSLYALDNISESAMGTQLNVQQNSESTYVKANKDMCKVVNMRIFKPWLMFDTLFNYSQYKTIQDKALRVLHKTTKDVIQKRKQELKEKKTRETQSTEEDDSFYQKKRMAFLDVLLESAEEAGLTDDDIREEVDTFMFEGHDTVSSGISFALYSLATHPAVQEEVYKEQMTIFEDADRDPTSRDLQEMKYLDRVLKESQRVYPTVPLVARKMHEDLPLSDGCVLPKGATAIILFSALNKDPEVFPNPDTFNPDNFLQEATVGRNPYAYVPFSAGPRNCVGQRFAQMEMKSAVSKVIRRFKLSKSLSPEDEVRPVYELVLVSANGVRVVIEPRSTGYSSLTN